MRTKKQNTISTAGLQQLTMDEVLLVSGGTGFVVADQNDQNSGGNNDSAEIIKEDIEVNDPHGGPNEPGSGDRDIG